MNAADAGCTDEGAVAGDGITPFCPYYHRAVELIGRRWSGAIVRALLSGAERFSDLSAAIPGLSDRLLSERLKELECVGVVVRTVLPETPVRIQYHLSEKGRDLGAVVEAVSAWAHTWMMENADAGALHADGPCDASVRDAHEGCGAGR